MLRVTAPSYSSLFCMMTFFSREKMSEPPSPFIAPTSNSSFPPPPTPILKLLISTGNSIGSSSSGQGSFRFHFGNAFLRDCFFTVGVKAATAAEGALIFLAAAISKLPTRQQLVCMSCIIIKGTWSRAGRQTVQGGGEEEERAKQLKRANRDVCLKKTRFS